MQATPTFPSRVTLLNFFMLQQNLYPQFTNDQRARIHSVIANVLAGRHFWPGELGNFVQANLRITWDHLDSPNSQFHAVYNYAMILIQRWLSYITQ